MFFINCGGTEDLVDLLGLRTNNSGLLRHLPALFIEGVQRIVSEGEVLRDITRNDYVLIILFLPLAKINSGRSLSTRTGRSTRTTRPGTTAR